MYCHLSIVVEYHLMHSNETTRSINITMTMTIARLQRLITLGSLIFWWSLGVWALRHSPSWVITCFVIPLLATPLILGIECLWAGIVNRSNADASSAAPLATARQWAAAWAAECAATMRVFMWWQPFRHNAIANHLQPTPGRRGVVLVHGFFCNRGLWTDWMAQLRSNGRVFIAVNLEPAFGSISDYAQAVNTAMVQVEKATGLPPLLIGHSMGGLAIRAWAAKYIGKAGSMGRVKRIITLGTPHHGTAIAVFSHTQNGSEMREASRWLVTNASQLPDHFAQHCTCYYSHCDNIVFPAISATLAGADNQHIAGHAHVQLVFSTEIQQACMAQLET
jgi:triacylglycerol lipase